MTTPSPDSTRYDPKELEARIYKQWRDNGDFQSALASDGTVRDATRAKAEPFVIVIPPPNVTGRLHMGHALNNTLQDLLIRYKRMDGYDALWIPGTDHAGIATQTVVKKELDANGVDYREIGRDAFNKKVWEWKDKYGDLILNQLARIGSSCDWQRTRFTMDEGLSRAVTHCFKKLYDDGLIYRGKRIVNWCPVDRTALADDEIETKDGGEPGFLWQIKYKLQDGNGELVVATTRPETLFGDVAVAVHPDDERYKHLIGKSVIVPLQERVVPIIADAYVEKDFGTGCLKITPAHDGNDFEVGTRHNLTPINIMNEDASLNDIVPERYRSMDRFKARAKAIEELKEQELLVSEEPRMTPLGRSYRSGAVIEYRLSDQWFVKMKPLAELALKNHDQLNIQPDRWNKVYLDWMNNIRDWCISRQIWWGHRIPAWFGADGKIFVATSAEDAQAQANTHYGKSVTLTQENDVLDTWFSSALWPMSTLGWPEKTADFNRYFPTTTLSTAKDIIFFWVARMNVMALYFEKKLPYKNVLIHPVVLDDKGETMSKSKGNGIDPITVIDGATLEELKRPVQEARPSNAKELIKRIEKNYPNGYEGVGADAMRYTLLSLCSSGQQLKLSLDSFQDIGRRFLTKLWNASRFVMMAAEQAGAGTDTSFPASDEDQWMKIRIGVATAEVRKYLDTLELTHLGETIYRLVWNDFCDWYIELCKARLNSEDLQVRRTAVHHLSTTLADILRLIHPIVPFVTEDIWQRFIPAIDQLKIWGNSKPSWHKLITADYPKGKTPSAQEQIILDRFARLQSFVGAIRTTRKAYGVKDAEKITVWIKPSDAVASDVLTNSQTALCRLAGVSELTVANASDSKPPKRITAIETGAEIALDLSAYIDIEKEKARLSKEIERIANEKLGCEKRFGNADFRKNAKEEIVKELENKISELGVRLEQHKILLKEIESW